jgi:hypothetical protein
VTFLRRILITAVIALAVLLAAVAIAPVVLSYHAANTALPITRVVPTDLKDWSISEASGSKLSYFGYEFEIPWSDLDEIQTKLYPNDKPNKCKVDLHFRSGLRLILTAVPPREWVNGLAGGFKVSPQSMESSFGQDAMKSDYSFVKDLYQFSPNTMHHWTQSSRVYSREQFLLMLKSMALVKSAESGIFNIQNQSFKGFQEGNPLVRQDGIIVHLFSDQGSVEVIFLQKDYRNPQGIAQPEINRIIQTFRKVTPVSSEATTVPFVRPRKAGETSPL